MSLKSLSNKLELGSSPRLSTKTASLFAPSKASASRLLSVPIKTASDVVSGSVAASSNAFDNAANIAAPSGSSFWRYLIIFFILVFLSVNLVLFLIKPTNVDITHLYDPFFTFLNSQFNTNFSIGSKTKTTTAAATTVTTKVKNNSALSKIEKALAMKTTINKIDASKGAIAAGTSAAGTSAAGTSAAGTGAAAGTQASNLETRAVKNYKKLPVIPQADDSTSAIQMNPTSKAGFCYIGEDRGFRSCIDVGAGDVCMSGDIFPTEAICINPNLRA